jgi:hypothetical protein
MANSGVSFHQAYRFETWGDETPVVGTVYKQSGGGWIAMVDGTDIKVFGIGRGPVADEAVRQARLPENERAPQTHSLTQK